MPIDVPGVVGVYITGGDHHLAIGRFAQDPSVLGGDAHGALTLTWVSGVVHDQDAIGLDPLEQFEYLTPIDGFIQHAPGTMVDSLLQ